MSWTEIHKERYHNEWTWSCGVCHYGMNIPWETSPSWGSALEEVLQHIEIHREVGQRPAWIPVL